MLEHRQMLAIFRVERYTYNWSSKMKAFFQFGRKSLLVASAIALIHNTLLNTREGDVILVDSTSSHIRNAFKPQLLKSSGMIKSEIKSSFLEFARQLVNSPQFREEAEKDMKALKEFIELFPFRKNPSLIDELTPEKLYDTGKSRVSFFHFFQFRLRRVGAITIYRDKPWREACAKIDLFKQLLKLIVDDSIPIHEKVDDGRWSQLKGWGGDKHYVKKLLFIYYPEKLIPTFKTELLEDKVNGLGLSDKAEDEAQRRFNERLENLTVGKKFEIYNEIFVNFVKSILPSNYEMDTCAIARLLDEFIPPPKPIISRKSVESPTPLSRVPMLYEPINELGVVLLFGMHHRELGFPYIIKVQQSFPDMIALDEEGNYCRIEFEYKSSSFIQHGHDPNDCDYIVCWIDDLDNQSPLKEKTLSLKEEIFEGQETELE